VVRARFGADADGAGADRFDGDAAALEHRDEAQSIGTVDDHFELRLSGLNAARVVRDRSHVVSATRLLAPFAAFATLVG
jgi:hypothetical protein